MRRDRDIPERYAIKNRQIGVLELLWFAVGLFLIYSGVDSEMIWLVLLGLGVLIGVGYSIIRHVRERDKEKIVIDNNGITLNFDAPRTIPWEQIKFAYIQETITGAGKSTRVIRTLHIKTSKDEIQTRMDGLSYSVSLLTKCIDHFSGREIGHISNEINHRLSQTLEKFPGNAAYSIFKAYYRRQMQTFVFIFLGMLGVAVFLQVIMDSHYVFAIGYTAAVIIMWTIAQTDDNRLRSNELFRRMSDDEFKEMKRQYGAEFGVSTKRYKGQNIVLIIVLVISVAIAFGVSYITINQ